MVSGSVTAIETGEEVGAAVVYISIMGAEAIRAARREHKKDVYNKEISAINALHLKYLADLSADGEKFSLPEIFVFKKDESKPQSIELNDQILEKLSTANALYDDPRLPRYGRHVLNAMASLREFYTDRFNRDWFHKGAEDDPESAVLAYLLLMLSTNCFKFESHAKAVVCLDGIVKFAIHYSDKKGKEEKSDRYDHLKDVIVELKKASFLLKDQMLSLSFETVISEFLTECRNLIEKMLKNGAQLIMKNGEWEHVSNLTPKKIKESIIKKSYPHYRSINLAHRYEIKFEESVLQKWLQACAGYYLQALNLEGDPDEHKNFISKKQFDPKSLTKKQMDILREKLGNCQNFLTMGKDIDKAVAIYSDYISLIIDLVIAYRFCSLLLNRAQQLGEIYISNPHHCVFIFKVLQSLGDRVKACSSSLSLRLQDLEKTNIEIVSSSAKEDLLTGTKDLIKDVYTQSIHSINTLVTKHSERLKSKVQDISQNMGAKSRLDSNKDPMFHLLNDLASELGVDPSHADVLDELKAENRQIKAPLANAKEKTESKAINQDVADHKPAAEEKPLQPEAPVVAPAGPEVATLKLAKVQMQIEAIQKQKQDPKISRYIDAFVALFAENLKALRLWKERPEKSAQVQHLVFTLADEMLQFLNKNLQERLDDAEDFAKKVESCLLNAGFLDQHADPVKQRLGIFRTESRSLANEFKTSCAKIAEPTEEQKADHSLGAR